MDNSFGVGLNCYGSYVPLGSLATDCPIWMLHLHRRVSVPCLFCCIFLFSSMHAGSQPNFLHLHILKNGIVHLWRPRQRVSWLVGCIPSRTRERLDVVCKQALQEVLSLNEAGSILLAPIYQLVCTTCVSKLGHHILVINIKKFPITMLVICLRSPCY